MRTLFIKILILISIVIFWYVNYIPNVSAEEGWVTVTVTERIPWLDCAPKENEEKWPYKCTIKKWFSDIIDMLGAIIKYFTFFVWLAWVLFIVINWIMYSMWWMDQELQTKSKERIIKTIIWLIVLLLSWIILNLVAPWIYK